jgi:Ca2+-binding RTX toxin-like protein
VSNLPAAGRAALLSLLPVALFVGVVVTASSVVPTSKAGRSTRSITANTLKPATCSAITLSGITTGTGVVTDGAASNLVLGSAVLDTMRGSDGNDCILGGGGNDSLRGDNGTDVCLGGPGTDTFYSTCETQIQ